MLISCIVVSIVYTCKWSVYELQFREGNSFVKKKTNEDKRSGTKKQKKSNYPKKKQYPEHQIWNDVLKIRLFNYPFLFQMI